MGNLAVITLSIVLILALTHRAAPLSSGSDLPEHVIRQVLNVEPNRHLQQLGEVTETPGMLTRTYFSSAHKRAAQKILRWMEQAGMTAYIDVMGNVHGVIEGTQPELGELMVGSHYDTVVDGGRFDGALGVLVGIAAVKAVLLEALARSGRLASLAWALDRLEDGEDIDLPARAVKGLLLGTVRVVGFADEEGIRFKSTFLGSRALAGSLIRHGQLASRGADGLSFEDVLRASGVAEPAEAVAGLALDAKRLRHYVEVHIEQGPQLEAAGKALGVVSGIAGQTWLAVAVEGVQNHGGTVPMALRRDPMAAAAEAVSAVEGTCLGVTDDLGTVDPTDEALVCTVGSMRVHPNQVNIIPKWANFTVDVRCRRQEFRREVVALASARIEAVCKRRGINCTITTTHDAPPVDSDPYLVSKLRAAVLQAQPLIADVAGSTPGDCSSGAGSDTCPAAGAASSGQSPTLATQDTVPVLLSGAGHDAMAMADVTDVAMMFVRCAGGVSHNPAEYAAPRDVAAATAALATFMKMDLLYPEDNLGEDPETIAA